MLPRLVLDTGTFVSAFFWDGNEATLLRLIEEGKAQSFITGEILREIEGVIKRPKFTDVMRKATLTHDEILHKILSLSHLIVAQPIHGKVCRDDNDHKFLECARSAKADFIVSGDNDLLVLKEYQGIRIVRTSGVLQLL